MLVLGATGVTGSMAVQLAKSAFGAGRVVVVGRDAARLEWLGSVGADEAITLGADDLGARVSATHAERRFDYLGGEPAETVLKSLSASHSVGHYHATRFVQIGSLAGRTMTLPAGILRSAGIVMSGVGIGSVPPEVFGRTRTEALPRMFDMVAAGELGLRTRTQPLADVESVWAAAEPSGTRVVLVP